MHSGGVTWEGDRAKSGGSWGGKVADFLSSAYFQTIDTSTTKDLQFGGWGRGVVEPQSRKLGGMCRVTPSPSISTV